MDRPTCAALLRPHGWRRLTAWARLDDLAEGGGPVPRVGRVGGVDAGDADGVEVLVEQVVVMRWAVPPELERRLRRLPGGPRRQILPPCDAIGRVAEVEQVLLGRGAVAE